MDTLLLEGPTGSARVIARHDRGAGPLSGTPFTLAREAATFAAVAGAGFPVPALVAVAPDGSAFAVEEVPGIPEAGAVALDGYLRALGQLHASGTSLVPADHPGFDADGTGDLTIWEAIAQHRVVRQAPIVDLAFERLHGHGAFTPSRVVLCHGDAGPGNYLHDGEDVTGLIDWEMAHTGEPHDDLASIAVRAALTGVDLGDYRARIAEHYEPVAGVAFDPTSYRVAVAAVLTRMVVSCLCALDHADVTKDRTVQLLGLPLMEAHLLRMLALLDGRDLPPPVSPRPDLAFASELTAAVRDGLSQALLPGATGAEAAQLRRLRYASSQLTKALGRQDGEPAPSDDLHSLWGAVHCRLAVIPDSLPIAHATIAGVT
jgi:aminoglycoside phosphotransferase (APT) family kinase protein